MCNLSIYADLSLFRYRYLRNIKNVVPRDLKKYPNILYSSHYTLYPTYMLSSLIFLDGPKIQSWESGTKTGSIIPKVIAEPSL